jgi:hypothetical protein
MAPPVADPTPDIRIIPSLVYTGGPSDPSPKDYIDFFTTYAAACGWDVPTSKTRLWLHLQGTGHPLQWRNLNRAWLMDAATNNWDLVVAKFIQDLNPCMGYSEDITLYTGSNQTVTETLLQYLERMKLLFRKVNGLTEAQAVNIMMDNVHSFYRNSIQAFDCSTFQEAETRFRKVDRFCSKNHPLQTMITPGLVSDPGHTGNTKTVLATIRPSQARDTRKCYYCNRAGHVRSECRTELRDMRRSMAQPPPQQHWNRPRHQNWNQPREQQWNGQRRFGNSPSNWHQQNFTSSPARPDGQRTLAWRQRYDEPEPWQQEQPALQWHDQRNQQQRVDHRQSRSPSPAPASKNGQWGRRSSPRNQQ